MRGGWQVADSADLFARFCERATSVLGDQIGMASPFNEANIHSARENAPGGARLLTTLPSGAQ